VYRHAEEQLDLLLRDGDPALLRRGLVGLEKESLRVSAEGGIAHTPHPAALGSPLTHPWITTDYSEALIEFITPPTRGVENALAFLEELQAFVYERLGDEILWATSMPCVLSRDGSIPVAVYGSSNAGRMKHIYRLGLGYRYGRVMQVIAGVHFNYSVAEDFWPMYQELAGDSGSLREFRDDAYMGLIRNLQRHGWLVPYLFGASPAVCKSFLEGRPTRLQELDATTYYERYATSLRMGDIGYQNRREEGVGIKACYDCVESYVDSLARAIATPAEPWERIGVKVDGEYRQLNANILQIENEYYSTVRPKQPAEGLEKPSTALRERGVRYVELRSVDVNAYHPLGVDPVQVRFLEAFMLFCLLAESPRIRLQERWEIDRNLEQVAHRGRDRNLRLMRYGRGVLLRQWADRVLDAMAGICEVLDGDDPERPYSTALDRQREKVTAPEITPSGRMLQEMRDRGEGFYQFARRLSHMHRAHYRQVELSPQCRVTLEREARASRERQAAIEAADEVDFDTFLARYQAQP
jgi:glutamate--cysteine ligase